MNTTLPKVALAATISIYNRYIYKCVQENIASLILYCYVILVGPPNRKLITQSSFWVCIPYGNYLWNNDILFLKIATKISAGALNICHLCKYVTLSGYLKNTIGFQRRYFIFINLLTRTAGSFKILKLRFLKTFTAPIFLPYIHFKKQQQYKNLVFVQLMNFVFNRLGYPQTINNLQQKW